ncbi:DsbA family protein [Serratia ficaria]|uniref:DsbA family protein n=1 Tax=Serratia ficaria TaxID=61651 RepID=UPI002178D3D2|nr:DsbA family protein [Serratia ficaria]CAI0837748.1 Thiol-disulfide oxidoreductase D [Serratia ficaria]CAI1081212.1 Thiol-disulfide oxidoreductase D [Serratia ficaria]CAI1657444.1 Thiol-disulfide oxidoreductase D [Serratia ficaria]CAI2467080.1 Thiol-disulfide oxidoreductase D [Serratia ficaria]CAI2480431.1 Thiol-disulfide oxidoreductase D [Serratia ficaria]
MKKLLVLLMLIVTPVWAAAPFTPEQEQRIKEIIRETLVSNPDILAQAVDAWQQQTAGQQISQAIKQNAKTLYEDPASPRLGASNAKLTLVTFTDYNCPYCKRFDPMLEKIVKQYPDVALVVKLLPFKGESSVSSARVALTTWQQHPDQFWPLHQRLMAKKGFHDNASIAAAQQTTGVKAVAPSEQSMAQLRTNMQLAEQLGVQGTPATLIGDRMLPGAVSYEELETLVKQQLAQAKNG